MKICIVGSSKKFYSGISAYTIAQANAFARADHEVSVVLLRNLVPKFLYPGRERIGKVDTLSSFDDRINVYDGMDWNSPRTWFDAVKFIIKKKPDAVIFHWWTSSVAHMQLFLVFAILLYGKVPLFLEMHEIIDPLEEKILPVRIYSRIAGKILKSQFDYFIAHSNEAREAVLNTYNISNKKISVIPHGPYDNYNKHDKNEARKELGLGGFVILHFGMIRQYKGIPILVKAFNMLTEEIANKSRLVIVGEDWGDDIELKSTIQNSPYRERILFKPEFVSDDMLAKYFSASDLVVLPYFRTSGSGVVNIALALGKHIISSDLDTMKEILLKYEGARFFPVGDKIALKEMLIKEYIRWQTEGTQQLDFKGSAWLDITMQYEKIIHNFLEKK